MFTSEQWKYLCEIQDNIKETVECLSTRIDLIEERIEVCESNYRPLEGTVSYDKADTYGMKTLDSKLDSLENRVTSLEYSR